MLRHPVILVFDSGLGGVTVLAPLVKLRPDARFVYAADDAVFPYGRLPEPVLIARVDEIMAELIPRHRPDIVVIACNTASTLVLPGLRSAWPDIPFVGTVPAIKPAAESSVSRHISVLATPGTVARDYTAALVRDFASHCAVKLVGSVHLAAMSEAFLRGEVMDRAAVAAEIAPAFVEAAGRRTDRIVLACTHFPLMLELFEQLAPWPVTWIDSAPAIARRAGQLLRARTGEPGPVLPPQLHPALFTSGRRPAAVLEKALSERGLKALDWALPAHAEV